MEKLNLSRREFLKAFTAVLGGAAILPACANDTSEPAPTPTNLPEYPNLLTFTSHERVNHKDHLAFLDLTKLQGDLHYSKIFYLTDAQSNEVVVEEVINNSYPKDLDDLDSKDPTRVKKINLHEKQQIQLTQFSVSQLHFVKQTGNNLIFAIAYDEASQNLAVIKLLAKNLTNKTITPKNETLLTSFEALFRTMFPKNYKDHPPQTGVLVPNNNQDAFWDFYYQYVNEGEKEKTAATKALKKLEIFQICNDPMAVANLPDNYHFPNWIIPKLGFLADPNSLDSIKRLQDNGSPLPPGMIIDNVIGLEAKDNQLWVHVELQPKNILTPALTSGCKLTDGAYAAAAGYIRFAVNHEDIIYLPFKS